MPIRDKTLWGNSSYKLRFEIGVNSPYSVLSLTCLTFF
jgi:hypothetical protein